MSDLQDNPRDVPAIEIGSLSFTYPALRRQPAQHALNQISMRIEQGQLVALLGPNGSGKSTLMRILGGLLLPHAGTVTVLGQSSPAANRTHFGVVFQSPALDGHLTVVENLRGQAALYGIRRPDSRTRIRRELADADLTDRAHAMVKSLSGGLKRRVDLIRALLHDPPLLLLDEPTAGLDPAAREQFLRSVESRRAARSLTVLLSTHLIDEADRCDRVVLMHRGRVVADDSPQALRRRLGSMRVTSAAASAKGGGMPPPINGLAWTRAGGGWAASLGDDPDFARRVAADLAGAGLAFSIAPPTLADLFEQLTGESLADGRESASEPSAAPTAGERRGAA